MNSTKKQQIWGEHLKETPNEANVAFCAGRDVQEIPAADQALLPYDIWTNLAHVKMLEKSKVLTNLECQAIQWALQRLSQEVKNGEFQLDPTKEDVHINVEHYVSQIRGVEAGKKIHTGRSRNDQVATDVRLYLRDQVLNLSIKMDQLVEKIIERAEGELDSYMPGFTHYQPAMLTTMAHWMASWSQALLRDLVRLKQDFEFLNLSPLGAAASFGSSWPLDREYSAQLLGFQGVQENTLDCITSRWEYETQVASTFAMIMTHLGVISQDLILLSLPYYNMIKISDAFVTGSSIMPQKRNPDFAEIIRGKTALSHGILQSLFGTQKGAMSGYNRDSQQTKYLIMDLFRECENAPLVLTGVIETLTVKKKEMRDQCEVGFMNSADVADWLSRTHGLAFRDCYNVLALAVNYSQKENKLTLEAIQQALTEKGIEVSVSQEDLDHLNSPEQLTSEKTHTGAPSPEAVRKNLLNQKRELHQLREQFQKLHQQVLDAKAACFAAK